MNKLHFSGIAVLIMVLVGFQVDKWSCRNEHDTTSDTTKDKVEIRDLIRKALSWAEGKKSINLFTPFKEGKDSLYSGLDEKKLNTNLQKLRVTGCFSDSFIENYKRIMLTLDKNLRNKVYTPWNLGDLPPFGFANDVDPWCNCQDFPDEKTDPWRSVEIDVISLNDKTGDMTWKWGNLGKEMESWNEYPYHFRVEKVHGKWKISYMQGFDFEEAVKGF